MPVHFDTDLDLVCSCGCDAFVVSLNAGIFTIACKMCGEALLIDGVIV